MGSRVCLIWNRKGASAILVAVLHSSGLSEWRKKKRPPKAAAASQPKAHDSGGDSNAAAPSKSGAQSGSFNWRVSQAQGVSNR